MPSPFTVFDHAVPRPRHQLFRRSVVTLQARRRGLRRSPILIGGVVGIAVARVERAARRDRLDDHRAADDAVGRVGPARDRPVPAERQGAILFVVVLGAAPSIANGIIDGIDNVPPILLRAGRVLGARGLRARCATS